MEPTEKTNRIREVRREKGLTQQQLAKQIGTTQQAIARWEKGDRDVKGGTLKKMSSAMGVSVSYLLGLEDDGTIAHMTALATNVAPVVREITLDDEGECVGDSDENHPVADDLFEMHPNAFWYAVQGSSMNRLFPINAMVLVDPDADVRHGDVGLVYEEGSFALPKRVMFEEGFMRLLNESYDPEYQDRIIRNDDPELKNIHLVGKIVSYTAPSGWKA